MKIGIDIGTKRLFNDEFKDKKVVLWDVQSINNEQLLKISFILTNSKNRQGIWLATDKGIEVNGRVYPQIDLWEDTAPKEVIIKCLTDVNLLSVYNIWDKGRGRNSQSFTSGMIIEKKGNILIYRCNDYGFETNFDKLIFTIEKL